MAGTRSITSLSRISAEQGTMEPPAVRVATRSGDTPQSDRRRMIRRPPDILITTPESLNILLTSDGGRALFTSLRTVILDEIHAVAGSNAGSHQAGGAASHNDDSSSGQCLLSVHVAGVGSIGECVSNRKEVAGGALDQTLYSSVLSC